MFLLLLLFFFFFHSTFDSGFLFWFVLVCFSKGHIIFVIITLIANLLASLNALKPSKVTFHDGVWNFSF